MATDRQQAHALITYFQRKYIKAFGMSPPGFNRHALAYGFEGLVKDYPGMGEKIIDFYFDNYEDPQPVKFTYEYGKVVTAIQEVEADEAERRAIRKRTIERMKNVTDSGKGPESGS